ncbi:MAG: cyclic nucleotide-binding domain-containing protein [Gammaproteobacteria bacterium]|nr:cyclic nucleotide-binding domain-containing protein [Gammaproteobacteria bacterium]
MVTEKKTSEKIDLAQFLNQQYLCETLTIKEVSTLIDYTELVVFNKNEVVAEIGEVGEALYFVISGKTALFAGDKAESQVGLIKAGELMGEMSFFDRNPRSVRAVALENDTRLLRLSRAMYKRLRVEHPYIAVNLLEHAIVSLDHLFRQVSQDVSTFSNYFYAPGRK